MDEVAAPPPPPWSKQITVRSMVACFLVSFVFNVFAWKLNLTTGIMPSLNVAAAFLGFAIVRVLSTVCGLHHQPFTAQENTVIQTSLVASSAIAFTSGTASYLLGMSPRIANQVEGGNTAKNVKEPQIGWMMAFLFTVNFLGLFTVVPIRKLMIFKYKLTLPTGTASARLINNLHTPTGANLAKKQVLVLLKSFIGSFALACFQWFFTAVSGCGFSSFPMFGLQAFKKRFYFDFSATYIGVGMICPHMVNFSLLIGAIFSWGVFWPFIESKEGDWYQHNLPRNSLHGIQGYRIFLASAMMLGDGVYQLVFMIIVSIRLIFTHQKCAPLNDDDKRRINYFLKDQIPTSVAVSGYIVLAGISTGVVPVIFPQLKWYHILVLYLVAPVLALCNSYGCGLTDCAVASIVFSWWVGLNHGGVLAGLASCGVLMSIVSTASGLMHDFKTGYLTLSSPRAMFFGQVLGTAIGCIQTPLVFSFFYKAFRVGDPNGLYPAPYAQIYRGMAVLGVEGSKSLPHNFLKLVIIFFGSGVAINLMTELLKRVETKYRVYRFMPSPMWMAIPFYLGGTFAIDMCIGSLMLFVFKSQMGPVVASGFICGDALWGVIAAVLSLAGVTPPICMKFLSAATNKKVDKFLSAGA